MQYVNGHDLSTQSIAEVQNLALTPKIAWQKLEQESDELSTIWGYQERGHFLNKGVSEFTISPENMYELLYNISSRKQWDLYCKEADMLEEYDHLNHIIRMVITHPLGTINMNLYRSCKYEPQQRLYVIAMRSIELESSDTDSFECLPNGWVIQGIEGSKDRCRLTFIQQSNTRNFDLQTIPGYKSFKTNEKLEDFHYLSIFPASVGGRLGKIFECLRSFISINVKQIEIKDTRLKILEQAEREVNEMFGASTVDYGFQSYLKKYDMEILVKKVNDVYYMVGKGSFSSLYNPIEIADLLYCDQPWGWDTFYDKGVVVENITENAREVELFYRMWHESFSTHVLQSVKRGPGNCSAMHWRSIKTRETVSKIDMELSFLPSGIFNYGLGEGSFTSFLVALEVKGAKTPAEEALVSKLFAARIISTQNHIINVMGKRQRGGAVEECLPVIPTIQSTGYEAKDPKLGAPLEFSNMVENFANLLLSDSISVNKKKASRSQDDCEKSKRKRNFVDESEEDVEEDESEDDESEEQGQQEEAEQKEDHPYANVYQQNQQQRILHLQQQQHHYQAKRQTIRVASNIVSQPKADGPDTEMEPLIWNSWPTTKRQPFLFLVNDNDDVTRIRRKDVSLSNSFFDNLPEEIVQLILSSLRASDILSASMVCKRFKIATDSSALWKQLYLSNPVFNKSVPKRYRPIQQMANPTIMSALAAQADQSPINLEQQPQIPPAAMVEEYIKLISMASGLPVENDSEKGRMCGCSRECICICRDSCNCECLNEDMVGVRNWRTQYLHRLRLSERWKTARPKKTLEMSGHTKNVKTVRAEGSSAISLGADKKVRFWNCNSGQYIGTYEEPTTAVVSIDYDRTAKSSVIWPLTEYTKVHIGHRNGSVAVVDFMERPYKQVSSQRPVLLADGFDFSSPNRYIIWESNLVECWEEEKKARLWVSGEHTKKINQARAITSSLFANGVVCTVSTDKTMKLRNIVDGALLSTMTGFTGAVNCVEPVGDYMLATGSSDRLVRLWDLRKLSAPIIVKSGHTGAVRAISYEEKGGRIITGGDDGVVVFWEMDKWNRGRRECIGVSNATLSSISSTTTTSQPIQQAGTCIESGRLAKCSSGITSIDSDEAGVIAGTQNGLIYRWDFA